LAIELREYCGFSFDPTRKMGLTQNMQESITEGTSENVPEDSLLADIEGIHSAPFATRNYTRYSKECLRNSVPYWTKPYRRPLIKHHNEKDGKIIGRILNVEYEEKSKNLPESGALLFTASIPKEPESSDVKSGLLETVSIGVIAHDVRCSICGQNIAEDGLCEHERGQVYDGQTCYWDVMEMEPKELSYVIVPSDSYAKNVKLYTSTPPVKKSITESVQDNLLNHKHGGTMEEQEKQALLDQIQTLKDQEATLLDEKKAVEAKLADAETKNTELQAKVDQLTGDVEKLKSDIEEAKEKLTTATTASQTAEEAQKTAEEQCVQAQEAYRGLLEKMFNKTRQMMGKKELAEDAVSKRSNESLLDAIHDLTEDMDISVKAPKVDVQQKVSDPTLPNLDEAANDPDRESNGKMEVREEVDLSKTLEKLFTEVATR
jgi:outer membrane murein-binding lipoprotein Lpp